MMPAPTTYEKDMVDSAFIALSSAVVLAELLQPLRMRAKGPSGHS